MDTSNSFLDIVICILCELWVFYDLICSAQKWTKVHSQVGFQFFLSLNFVFSILINWLWVEVSGWHGWKTCVLVVLVHRYKWKKIKLGTCCCINASLWANLLILFIWMESLRFLRTLTKSIGEFLKFHGLSHVHSCRRGQWIVISFDYTFNMIFGQ